MTVLAFAAEPSFMTPSLGMLSAVVAVVLFLGVFIALIYEVADSHSPTAARWPQRIPQRIRYQVVWSTVVIAFAVAAVLLAWLLAK